ncbi:MAG: transcription termination factor NusA [Anaerolineae bacterium]|nr:transcription termination factor NusA [Anaerolineae bacterium]
MKNDFLVAITQLCNERGLSKEVVIQAVEHALVSAYKRNFGGGQNITAQIDPTTGKVRIFALKTVVDEVRDKRLEISLQDARAYDPMAQVGMTIKIESTPNDFGRIAAQAAKQVIMQRIREAERDALYQQFAQREGEIILGTVHTVDRQNITVNLGKVEAQMPASEQIPTERYRPNQKIRAYIAEVNKTARGPQIILSRTHRNFLRRLFELEVPEIFQGLVEIKAIAREPGSRSKIAVAALQDGIDPVGACVGQRGVRIQAIVNELNGEKIDVVEWSPDPAKFIANALSPAKVLSVETYEDENGDKVANVVVEQKQLSLAIGKEGQNARLAARLTGWRIDIKSDAQLAEEAAAREQAATPTPEQLAARAALAEWEAMLKAEEETAPTTETTPTAEIAETVAAIEPVSEMPTPATVETETPAPMGEVSTPETAPIEALVAEAPSEAIAPTAVVETPTPVAETPTPVVETPAPAPEPEPEISFEQALAQFEEDEELYEEKFKRKADRRSKRVILEYDEELGKVVPKRKRKGSRRQEDWEDEIE